jgi:hypothetical protein
MATRILTAQSSVTTGISNIATTILMVADLTSVASRPGAALSAPAATAASVCRVTT